jgi:midasin
MRSLGDALEELRRRIDQIAEHQDSNDDLTRQQVDGSTPPQALEYLSPDDVDQGMEALGPAGDEQAQKLAELNLLDEETEAPGPMKLDEELPAEQPIRPDPLLSALEDHPQRFSDIEDAIMIESKDIADQQETVAHGGIVPTEEKSAEDSVEAELRKWMSSGHPDYDADYMWHRYESLTHDLSFTLCEQLRLILEPTKATRLKGDYRSGKRLNMKRIIPYIASDYTKDKIWLRRTKPSQREYQILLALDDSRSMAESHSVHLAFETLALISKALAKLEAGDIGVIKFGETVEVLHDLKDGTFTDQAGIKVMKSFKFNQKATNVQYLLQTSLAVLMKARETRAMTSSSAADLWQLQIIISDGMCQDHEKLRALLRRAEEQRIMIVFIIVDSLNSTSNHPGGATATQGSILTMERAEFKNMDGKLELQLQRYLDSFPFQYYVVLRDVGALPEVLSATLKQFFERISEE